MNYHFYPFHLKHSRIRSWHVKNRHRLSPALRDLTAFRDHVGLVPKGEWELFVLNPNRVVWVPAHAQMDKLPLEEVADFPHPYQKPVLALPEPSTYTFYPPMYTKRRLAPWLPDHAQSLILELQSLFTLCRHVGRVPKGLWDLCILTPDRVVWVPRGWADQCSLDTVSTHARLGELPFQPL